MSGEAVSYLGTAVIVGVTALEIGDLCANDLCANADSLALKLAIRNPPQVRAGGPPRRSRA